MKKPTICKQVFAFILALLFGFMTSLALAEPNPDNVVILKPTLNKITYNFSAEDWAKTSTAKVDINVDAVAKEDKLEQVRTDILKKLNQLAPNAQWHITNFTRNQDQSGLERLQMQAQARVNNSALGNLREQAKALSKPGETITINNIDYSPSLAEVEATRLELHKQIYNQAKAELSLLNQTYPNQKYYLHDVKFLSQQEIAEPQPMMRMSLMATSAKASTMPVADKIIVTARVVLASNLNSNL